jgi:hypothetical protein
MPLDRDTADDYVLTLDCDLSLFDFTLLLDCDIAQLSSQVLDRDLSLRSTTGIYHCDLPVDLNLQRLSVHCRCTAIYRFVCVLLHDWNYQSVCVLLLDWNYQFVSALPLHRDVSLLSGLCHCLHTTAYMPLLFVPIVYFWL